MFEKAVQEVAIKKFTRRKQVREKFDQEYLAGLAQSIKEHGVLQPVLAHREGSAFVLDDGDCRLLAAEMAGLETVPARIDPRELTQVEVAQRQLVSNCQRRDLTSMETAVAIERLMAEAKWSQAEVAKKLGFSQGKVSRLLALLELPASVQEEVAAGTLPASSAYQIARAGDTALQEQLADAARKGLTRDSLAAKVRSEKRGNAGRAALPKVTCALGEGRSVTVSGAGLATLADLIQWLGDLVAKARKARPQHVELATFCSWLKDEARAAAKREGGTSAEDDDGTSPMAVRA